MAATSPFGITAPANLAAGYSQKLCVQCANAAGYAVQTANDIIVTQGIECTTAMSVRQGIQDLTFPPTLSAEGQPNSTRLGWNSFFQILDPIQSNLCPVNSCKLKAAGCLDELPAASPVTMQPSGPWWVYAKTNVPVGYSLSLCVTCQSTAQTVKYPNWQVTVTAHPCAASLTKKDFQTTILLPQSASPSQQVLTTNGWQTFFSSTDIINCPIISCRLKDGPCSSVNATDFLSPNLVISGAQPWDLTASRNVPAGYSASVCYSCAGVWQTIQTSLVVQQQTGCVNALVSTELANSSKPLVVSQSFSSRISSFGWRSFFVNRDEVNCPISSCSLKTQGCSSALSATTVQMTSTWDLIAQRDAPAGYTLSVCYQCVNAFGTFTLSFDVQQTADCTQPRAPIKLLVEAPQVFPYKASGRFSVSSTPLARYLAGSDPANCTPSVQDVSSCSLVAYDLKSSSCIDAAPQSTRITVDNAASNFSITADQTVPTGYLETVCLKCNVGSTNSSLKGIISIQQSLGCTPATVIAAAQVPNSISVALLFGGITAGQQLGSLGYPDLISFPPNDQTCLPSTCTLVLSVNSSCTASAYSGSDVKLSAISPYFMTATVGKPEGYAASLCLKCSYPADSSNTVVSQPFTVSQHRDCRNPAYSKVVQPSFGNKMFDGAFNSTSPFVLTPTVRSIFVTTAQSLSGSEYFESCDFSQCQLFTDEALSIPYTGGNIIVGGSPSFQISARLNIPKGYSETVQLRCAYAYDKTGNIFETTGFTFTQQAACPSSSQSQSPLLPRLSYDPLASSGGIIASSDTVFGFSQATKSACPFSTCTLKSSDCRGAYAGTHLSIFAEGSSGIWKISGTTFDPAGWEEEFCVLCIYTYYPSTSIFQAFIKNEALSTSSQKSCASLDHADCNKIKVALMPTGSEGGVEYPLTYFNASQGDSMWPLAPVWGWSRQAERFACAFSKCDLFIDPNYRIPYRGPNIAVARTVGSPSIIPDYSLSIKKNDPAGFVESKYLQCVYSYDLASVSKLLIKASAAIYCPYYIGQAPSLSYFNKTIYYDQVSKWQLINPRGYEDFFTNRDATGVCKIRDCKLYDPSCKDEVISGSNPYMSLDTSSPDSALSRVFASKQMIQGYELNFCYKCSYDLLGNSVPQTIAYKFTVSSEINCPSYITKKPIPTFTLEYDESIAWTTLTQDGWGTFFNLSWFPAEFDNETDRMIGQMKVVQECSFQSCRLYYSDCVSPYLQSDVFLDYFYNINAVSNYLAGYSHDFCVRCIGPKVLSGQLSQIFTVTQKPSCIAMLPAKTAPNLPQLSYADTQETVQLNSNGFKDFFDQLDEKVCIPTSCILYDQACVIPYNGQNVQIDSLFNLFAVRNNTDRDGYRENLCVVCATSDGSFIQSDTIEVSQQSPCENALALQPRLSPYQSVVYSASENKIEVTTNGWNDFFTNTVESCVIQWCQLLKQGCIGKSDSTTVFMSPISPWSIYAQLNTIEGKNTSLCIQCSNGYQTLQTDYDWTLQQQQKPYNPLQNWLGVINPILPRTLDCSRTLGVVQGLTSPAPMEYVGYFNTLREINPDGWRHFFNNSKPITCPIQSCSLLQEDCTTPFGSLSDTITIVPTSGIIYAKRDQSSGYSVPLCISCSNIQQTVMTQVPYLVSQTAKSWGPSAIIDDIISFFNYTSCQVIQIFYNSSQELDPSSSYKECWSTSINNTLIS